MFAIKLALTGLVMVFVSGFIIAGTKKAPENLWGVSVVLAFLGGAVLMIGGLLMAIWSM